MDCKTHRIQVDCSPAARRSCCVNVRLVAMCSWLIIICYFAKDITLSHQSWINPYVKVAFLKFHKRSSQISRSVPPYRDISNFTTTCCTYWQSLLAYHSFSLQYMNEVCIRTIIVDVRWIAATATDLWLPKPLPRRRSQGPSLLSALLAGTFGWP